MRKFTIKECSKCKQPKDISLFVKDKRCKDGATKVCLECRTIYNRDRYKNNREQYLNKHYENKERIKENLGGKYNCNDCEYTYKTSAPYDIHHIDSKTKDRGISQMITYSWTKIQEELDKCVLLCACCHRIRHEEDRT